MRLRTPCARWSTSDAAHGLKNELIDAVGQSGGRMGERHNAFLVQGDVARADFEMEGLILADDVPASRLAARRELLDRLESERGRDPADAHDQERRDQDQGQAGGEGAKPVLAQELEEWIHRRCSLSRAGPKSRCVGRDGFQWSGIHKITRKQEWPDWTPPPEMIQRQPYLPRFMAGGPGGQAVQRTNSACRLTHVPTGIVVQCQNERSQAQNKATAMRLLRARLLELEERKRAEELAAERGEQKDVAWGSQIRSYVLHPSQRVKDHRTGHEVGDAQRVLDGDLDGFVREYLLSEARG